jgi:hypothetical protein
MDGNETGPPGKGEAAPRQECGPIGEGSTGAYPTIDGLLVNTFIKLHGKFWRGHREEARDEIRAILEKRGLNWCTANSLVHSYQGSLRGRSHEILVFTNLLATCDRDGYVDRHFRAIAEDVGISEGEVRSAILNLEAPDPDKQNTGCWRRKNRAHRRTPRMGMADRQLPKVFRHSERGSSTRNMAGI